MSSDELRSWPEYEEYFTRGFVSHRGYTHMARKARMQMDKRVSVIGPSSLWVMSKKNDHRDDVEAVMIGLFYFVRREVTMGVRIPVPMRYKSYHSTSLTLPLQRRQRSGTAMLKRCEDCIQELILWNKMEDV